LDIERIAMLLHHIAAHGRLDPADPRSRDLQGGNWHSYDKNDPESNYDLVLTPDAYEDLVSIMRELRTDQQIAAHVEYKALETETIKGIAKASAAFDQGAADEETIAAEVVALLTRDVRDWHVVVHVPGLNVAEGVSMSVAGMEIGSLPPDEYRRLVQLGQDWGSTARLTADAEIGSAAEHCKQLTQELLSEGRASWAWGLINATKETVDRTAYEHVYEVALNILRCFIPRSARSHVRERASRRGMGHLRAADSRRKRRCAGTDSRARLAGGCFETA
jgi:hypothetical protein